MKIKAVVVIVVIMLLSAFIVSNTSYSFDPTFTVEATPDCEFINLTWSSVENANGYYVYRGIGQGNQVPEPITDFPLKDTSYEDWNDIEAGIEYCYFIRAVGADHKEFAQSNEVCAVPVCPDDCRLELKFQVGNNVYWIDGKPQPAMEAAPEVKWSRTFVLIRYAAETAGATVGWEGSTKSITVETLDGTLIKMQVGNNKATINGQEVPIDANNSKVTPYIVGGRTLCPLRFTGVNLGATGPEDILWDGDTKSAMLYFQDPNCGSNVGGGGDNTESDAWCSTIKFLSLDGNSATIESVHEQTGEIIDNWWLDFTGSNTPDPKDVQEGACYRIWGDWVNPSDHSKGLIPTKMIETSCPCDFGSDVPGGDPVIDPEPGVNNIFPINSNPGGGNYTPPNGNPVIQSNFTAGLGDDWIPIHGAGGDFEKYAKLSNGSLVINVPEGATDGYRSWGWTGIRSKDPYFVVSEDMNSQPIAITLDFDSEYTDNYAIVLSTVLLNDPPGPDTNRTVWTYFNTSPYQTQAKFGIRQSYDDDATKRLTNITPTAPRQVTLTVKPGFLRASTSHGYKTESDCSWLVPDAKVYLYIFTSSIDAGGQPINMKLDSVRLYNGWSNTSDYTPPTGNIVYTENFEGNEGIRWIPIESDERDDLGGDYKDHASFGDGKFIASVPRVTAPDWHGFDDWSGVGIKSKYYFVEVTEGMVENPFTVFFDIDQIGSTGYRLSLQKNGSQEIFTGFNLYDFGITPTFRCSNYNLQFRRAGDNGAYRNDILPISPRYISLTIKPGFAKVSTSHGFSNEIECDWLTTGSKLFLRAWNIPDESDRYAPSSLSLNSIEAMRFNGVTFTDYKAPTDKLMYVEEFDELSDSVFEKMGRGLGKDSHVSCSGGKLRVSIPGGSDPLGGVGASSHAGIRMKYPFFGVTEDLQNTPLKIIFKFDTANTTEYTINFTHQGPAPAWDNFLHNGVQFEYAKTPEGQIVMSLKDYAQNDVDSASDELIQSAIGVPETVTFIITPKHVEVVTSNGDKLRITNHLTHGFTVRTYENASTGSGIINFQVYASHYTKPYKTPIPVNLSLDSIIVTK